MEIQKRVLVTGRVQGVGFRAATVKEVRLRAEGAAGAPLHGYVRNLPDGRVEAVFRGPEETVTAMVDWCSRGPRMALVERIEILEEAPDPLLPRFAVA